MLQKLSLGVMACCTAVLLSVKHSPAANVKVCFTEKLLNTVIICAASPHVRLMNFYGSFLENPSEL